jgi:hypothetical protein
MLAEETWTYGHPSRHTLRLSLARIEGRPGFTLSAAFRNGTSSPVQLREIALIDASAPNLRCDGSASEWFASSMEEAVRNANLAEPLEPMSHPRWSGFGGPPKETLPAAYYADGRWRVFNDHLTLFHRNGTGLFVCPAGAPRADLRIDLRVDPASLLLRVVSRMSDVVVEPGETRESQEALFWLGAYDEAVETGMRWIAATHGSRSLSRPVFGWCSWYDKLDEIAEPDIVRVAETVRAHRDVFPFEYIQIDDGWQRTWGDWKPNKKFPRGLGPSVGAIRKAGAIPAIWMAPIAVNDAQLKREKPGWFQSGANGERGLEGEGLAYLDPTHPEVREWIRGAVGWVRAQGFSYFKIDYNEMGQATRWHNRNMTRLQAYRSLYGLYREVMGDSYLLACAGFLRGVIGYADAARIGWDSRAYWDFPPGKPPICIHEALRCVGQSAAANGIFFANDPDVSYLLPRDEMTAEELKTWHGFVGLLGGTMMISEPIYRPEYLAAARMGEILNPAAPETGRSFGDGADPDHGQFGVVAERAWGTFAAIQLWNTGSSARRVPLETRKLAALGDRFHVWSFWDRKYLGITGAGFTTGELAPRHSVILRLTPVGDNARLPILIGSDLHITMGAAEIDEVAASEGRVRVRLGTGGARNGSLYFLAGAEWKVVKYTGCRQAAVSREGEVIELKLNGREGGKGQEIVLSL